MYQTLEKQEAIAAAVNREAKIRCKHRHYLARLCKCPDLNSFAGSNPN